MPKTQVNSATLIIGVTGCVAGDTVIRLNRAKNGHARTIEREVRARQCQLGPSRRAGLVTYTRALRGDRIGLQPTEDIVYSGVKRTFRLVTQGGPTVRATADHGIHTPHGFIPLGELREGMEVTAEDLQRRVLAPADRTARPQYVNVTGLRFHPFCSTFVVAQRGGPLHSVQQHRLVAEAHLNGLPYEDFVDICRNTPHLARQLLFLDPTVFAIHHRDHDTKHNDIDNLRLMSHEAHGRLHGDPRRFGEGFVRTWQVRSVEAYGEENTFDVICEEPYRNFLANGLVVHNSGKSSLIHTLARYVWRRWHKVTRYYTSDGGGFPAKIQELQAAGIIEVFRMLTRDAPEGGLSFETCYRSCQGWWPKRIVPSTGEVPPGVEMVPPIIFRYTMICPAGHPVKSVPAQSLLTPSPCPTCKIMTTAQNMRVEQSVQPNKGFEHVGAVAFDGLTSMLAWELREMGQRAGRMELKGEEGAIGGKVVSGQLKFGGTTRSHVGFAQTRGEELAHLTLGIPNLVVPPIFTALTHEDVDDRGLSIKGPKIAGRAKTDEAPQWFGNVLETAKIPALDGSNGEQRVLYLSEFTDTNGVRHLLKNRAAPGTLPAMLVDPIGGDADSSLAFSQVDLGLFFQLLDDALEKSVAETILEFPDAPGMQEGFVEIGDATAAIAAAPMPTGPQGPTTMSAPAPGGTGVAPKAPAPAPRGRKPATPAVAPIAAAPAGNATPASGGEATAQLPAAATLEMEPPLPLEPVAPIVVAPVQAPPIVAKPAPPLARPTVPAAPAATRMAPPAGARPPGNGPTASLGVRGPSAPRPPAGAPRPPTAAPTVVK